MENNIKIWNPISGIPSKVFVKELKHKDGLTIVLANDENENEIISLYFKWQYGYRNLDESYHLRTWDEIPFLIQDWSLFITRSGDFIEMFNHLTYDIYKGKVVNYIIATSDDIVEVIAHEELDVVVTRELISPFSQD